ncbi:MAG: hypothetical protein K9J12_09240 [Melioribacteraceae bacterium]|nr:hypothetical protein [Melioribacteraceae bacterium]MCF8265886.1 hypothetical protein [Melioribacteraceae bacterium]MCF8413435.1 hypothetical protein [Melioribacteraceae bacterium]MCF8432669.1 hypothetical protein [Melioribacteraceae bacterium]
MKYLHEFKTPRNLYEKLIREYEQLDMVISGDNFFNFASTVTSTLEFIKKSDPSTGMKRFLSRASRDEKVKLCKDILSSKKTFRVEIIDETAHEGATFKHNRIPEDYDIHHKNTDTRKFSLIFDGNTYDPFEFKEEILSLFDLYFKVKGQSHK